MVLGVSAFFSCLNMELYAPVLYLTQDSLHFCEQHASGQMTKNTLGETTNQSVDKSEWF